MASWLHTAMQRPQPTHLLWSMLATWTSRTLPLANSCSWVWSNEKALWAQIFSHWRHPMHLFCETLGLPAACCSILPAREPPPMPRFFMAPPKPACSWPLKWVRLMTTSASMRARPILAFLTYSPPSTGTSTSSRPLRPSAMMVWHPVWKGLKPLA